MATVHVEGTSTPRVFINCPFDQEYEPLFDALVFVAVAYNFMPTTSYADDDISATRIDRLRRQLEEAPFSVHDLSRCTGEGEFNVARMNMPFELGMAIMRQHLGESVAGLSSHQWAAFVPTGHLADQFISDLAGYDLFEYGGKEDIDGLIARAAQFFYLKSPVDLKPDQISDKFNEFEAAAQSEREKWAGKLPWSELVKLATEHAAALLGGATKPTEEDPVDPAT